MKIAFCTLGCKVNHYDTQCMLEQFVNCGWEVVPFSETADVYLINTCSVTQISDKKSRQMISQAHRLNDDALICVTGCYAQVSPEEVGRLPGVGLVVGTDGRKDIVSLVESALSGKNANTLADIRSVREFEEMSAVADSRTRATLKIQDGCDNYCSYCIIPYARGHIRSRSLDNIRTELERLASNGFKEVVLTGIHLASYGKDLNGSCTLTDAIRTAAEVPGLERIRLGSLEPGYCDQRFANEISSLDKVCRQFHLSLQSGSDSVLRRMNRKYTTSEYRHSVELLREKMPDCSVTTDVIAGFVAETEREHLETCSFLRDIGFARIHVFPYSRRRGTVADRMDGHLEKSIRNSRAAELISIGEELEGNFIESQIGTVQSVLVEDDGTGYTNHYVRVRCNAPEGSMVKVRIIGHQDKIANGEVIENG